MTSEKTVAISGNQVEAHGVVAGLFRNEAQAERAMQELKAAGFSGSQIGVACSDPRQEKAIAAQAEGRRTYGSTEEFSRPGHRSLLERLKDFFTGEKTDYTIREDLHGSLIGMSIPENQARYFEEGVASGGTLVVVRTDGHRAIDALPIPERNGADTGSANVTTGRAAGATTAPSSGEQRIALMGEMLRVHKERVSRGEVRVRKEVVTENRNVEVPVTREEVVVQRVPVDREAGQFESGQKEIRVPVSEEQVRIEKQPVVTEEVKVSKRPVEETKKVSDKVRRERLRVEPEGGVSKDEVKGVNDREKK